MSGSVELPPLDDVINHRVVVASECLGFGAMASEPVESQLSSLGLNSPELP